MKIFLLICAIAVASGDRIVIKLTPKALLEAQPYINKCQAETNPPPNAFHDMLTGTIQDDATLKFAYCYLLARNYIDKEARFMPTNLKPFFTDEKVFEQVKNVLEECNKLTEEDHMDLLRLRARCFMENIPVTFAQ